MINNIIPEDHDAFPIPFLTTIKDLIDKRNCLKHYYFYIIKFSLITYVVVASSNQMWCSVSG